MTEIQLFLNVTVAEKAFNWYKQIANALNSYGAIERVDIVKADNESSAQITIIYQILKSSLDKIESIVVSNHATINKMNIHLSTEISGTSNPYGASAIAMPIEDELKTIKGVLGSSISSSGEIKLEIDPQIINKQLVLEQVVKTISAIKGENRK